MAAGPRRGLSLAADVDSEARGAGCQHAMADAAIEAFPLFAVLPAQLDETLGVECVAWIQADRAEELDNRIALGGQTLKQSQSTVGERIVGMSVGVGKLQGNHSVDDETRHR